MLGKRESLGALVHTQLEEINNNHYLRYNVYG